MTNEKGPQARMIARGREESSLILPFRSGFHQHRDLSPVSASLSIIDASIQKTVLVQVNSSACT